MCGEKQAAVALPQPVLGSPPRMRGKACLTLIIRLLLGITPAHAGKSLPAVLKCPPTRDHPRVCGEKRRVRSWRALLLGSPPRMRGKVVLSSENPLCRGITPAYAGKRRSIGRLSQPTRDHPRVCGEKSANPKVRDTMEGASPRMRGKVFFFTGASFCAIFFLEPSGNLLLEPSGSSWVPPDGSIFVFAIGLPPRVRGKAITFREQDSADGITPAYAGKRWTPCHTEPCT